MSGQKSQQCKEVAETIESFESSGYGQDYIGVSAGTRCCMQRVRSGQDHKDSISKSSRDPSRREAGEGVHRRDVNFQSRVTVRVPVLLCVYRPVHEVRICGPA